MVNEVVCSAFDTITGSASDYSFLLWTGTYNNTGIADVFSIFIHIPIPSSDCTARKFIGIL
jgi:hypothetical protein